MTTAKKHPAKKHPAKKSTKRRAPAPDRKTVPLRLNQRELCRLSFVFSLMVEQEASDIHADSSIADLEDYIDDRRLDARISALYTRHFGNAAPPAAAARTKVHKEKNT